MTEIAFDLVAITSVNPTLGGPADGEQRVAEYIADLCTGIGCDVVLDEVLPNRPNVLASLHHDDAYATLVIEGHLDTVAVPTEELLSPRVVNGRLIGRGSCDTKGGIAAALHALERLQHADLTLNVQFLGSVDEEVAFLGVTHYLEHHPRADAAIVIEPTSLIPVVAHAGCLRGELRAHGRAAHSATPEQGDNAIMTLTHALADLKLWAERREPNLHMLSGRTSFSVTTIRGGIGINTIPAECVAEFDWRLHPADDPQSARDDLSKYLSASASGVAVGIISLMDWGLDLDVDQPVVAAAREACSSVTHNATLGGLRAGTDASKFVRSNVPAVVLGPGSVEQAHTADEWIDLEEVARAAELYVGLCQALSTVGDKPSA